MAVLFVEVKESRKDEPGGTPFMVNSARSNALVSDDTGGKGNPEFKNINARISLVRNEITTLQSLMEFFRK